MKNILIVCIQGLTSGILARKLNMTAERKKEDYRFLSCGISDAAGHLEWADYVILTPQVRDRAGKLDEDAEKYGAVCLTLSDTAISFQKTDETFDNIVRAVSPDKKTEHPESRALADALIMTAPLIVPGLIAGLAAGHDGGLLRDVYAKTAGIACLWFAPAYGYYLFSRRRENGLTGMLAGLLILLILTPFRSDIAYAPEEFRLFHGVMDISGWSFIYLPVCAAAEAVFLKIVLACSDLQSEYVSGHHRRIADRSFILFMALPLTVMTALLLIVRAILLSLF